MIVARFKESSVQKVSGMSWRPDFRFFYGSMGDGKSTMLVQKFHNLTNAGKSPLALLPSFSHRRDEKKERLYSRLPGISIPCREIALTTNLFEFIQDVVEAQDVDMVLIDEAQFLSRAQVFQLVDVVERLKLPIECYGLLSTYQATIFEGSAALIVLAECKQLPAGICRLCGGPAKINALFENGKCISEGPNIRVGDMDEYMPLCRTCWRSALRS